MKFQGPIQRSDDLLYDYCSEINGSFYPIGYCAGFREWTKEDCDRLGIKLNHPEIRKANKNRHKFHTDGHLTEEDACECYKQYLLDIHTDYNLKNTLYNCCKICGALTNMVVEIPLISTQFCLCKHHNNEKYLYELLDLSGVSWIS